MSLAAILIILITMHQDHSSNIFDFKNAKNTADWKVVDDRVMGGLSEGSISLTGEGNALYKGYVTTENNGGFSSVRYAFGKKDVSKFKHVKLKIKGDGKSYQFRIKENSSQGYSYITTFSTSGEWETIKLSFHTFYPSFRGNTLDKPKYQGEGMEEVALLIGNKKKESFSLEISKIYLE